MGTESPTYISDLNTAWPLGSDPKTTADNHIRNVKTAVKNTFPNVAGAVTPTHTEFNYLVGVTSGIQSQIAAKGAVAGQTWTGTHAFPSTTSIGTVTGTEISYLSGVTSAIQTQINAKGAITGQAWTGTHTFPTQTQGDNSTKAATTAYVDASKLIGDWVRVSTATASSSTQIAFTGLSSTYDVYMIEVINAKPASNGVNLSMQTSANNGASYDSGASNYVGSLAYTNTTTWSVSVPSNTLMTLSGGIASAREGFSGFIFIYTPSSAVRCHIRSEGSYQEFGANAHQLAFSSWVRDTAAAVNAVRVYMSTGNIASGTFNLYGRKKT